MDTNFVTIDFSHIYYFYFHIETDFKLKKRHRPSPIESFSQNNKKFTPKKTPIELKSQGH